ncbi:MAG: hypothetical protein QOF21_1301 [Actinomycetota bacterium]|jgi:hypothetical protein
MTITPDDKDWTWVLEARCEECGFNASTVRCTDVAQALRLAVFDWGRVLISGADVRVRPKPDVWSPLEYGCHVRDVFRVYDGRVRRMLAEDGPHYENWDQDATAIADDYGSQDPETVAGDLASAGAHLADLFDSVEGAQWERTGYRSDGAAFTIDTISRYFIHDIVHHVWDVQA